MTAPSLGLDWLHSYVSSDGAEARAENERRSRPVRIGPLIFAAAHPQRNAERVVEIWRCSSCGLPVEPGSLYCEDNPECSEPAPIYDTRSESEYESEDCDG